MELDIAGFYIFPRVTPLSWIRILAQPGWWVCARAAACRTQIACMGKSGKIMGKYSGFAVECAKISIWLSFVISYGCTGEGVGGCQYAGNSCLIQLKGVTRGKI